MVEKSSSATVRISLLEKDMERANTSLDKLSAAMDRHREESISSNGKIYDRMEDLRSELKEDIQSLKAELEKQITSQNEILKKIDDKLSGLDKWRWIVVGIATGAGYFFAKFSTLFGVTLK